MSERTRTPIGFRNQTEFDLYRLRQWWEAPPTWFHCVRTFALGAAVILLAAYCVYQGCVDLAEQIIP